MRDDTELSVDSGESEAQEMRDSQTPLVALQCERHTYPDGTVGMHSVEFSVFPDEIVALVGTNGAGKSTLLEHLNGTLVPDDGELRVNGSVVTEGNVGLARREVGFVFQDPDTQLVAPTVLDDVTFGLQNRGVPPEEARVHARDALETVGASHLEGRVPHHLSGGEKRLVGLAGVLVLDPSVIVFDEPFAGLDPERSRLIADRIRQLRREGISVVVSTHDLDLAAELADRVCVMDEGNIVARGSPRTVFYESERYRACELGSPAAVRLAESLDLDCRPVTETELVECLSERQPSRAVAREDQGRAVAKEVGDRSVAKEDRSSTVAKEVGDHTTGDGI
jgi:cobalt/nickel transport system ATP-binding protein